MLPAYGAIQQAWPYNLYCMIHAKSREDALEASRGGIRIGRISTSTRADSVLLALLQADRRHGGIAARRPRDVKRCDAMETRFVLDDLDRKIINQPAGGLPARAESLRTWRRPRIGCTEQELDRRA